MNITDWGLNQNEIDRARGVLRDDERVVLVLQPEPRMHPVEAVTRVLPGLVLVGLLGYVAALFGDF